MLLRRRITTAVFSTMALLITFCAATTAMGQQAQTAAPNPQAKGPDFVEEKAFKGKVFEIKYRDPNGLLRAIQPLASGFKGATMSANQEFRTLTVRDFPENIGAIEEAIKRLDVPEAPRPDIEFRVHVLIASDAASITEEVPVELADVIKQMKSTLKFKTYNLMTSVIQRAKEGLGTIDSNGIVESKLFSVERPHGNPIFYNIILRQPSLDRTSGTSTIQINEFRFWMRIPLALGPSEIRYENVGFQTPVSLRDGEKVIVGTTTMADKGVVVVLSARVLK